MTATIALIRKNLHDSRWMLAILGTSLFWLCWLFVFFTSRMETGMRAFGGNAPRRLTRGVGADAMDFSTAAIEMSIWITQPLFFLMFSVFAISRGSIAVSGEIEKGTMDLVLARPVARWSFLTAQISATALGLGFLGLTMVLGNQAGAHYNTLETPPSPYTIAKATFNLTLIGWAIYGYTFLFSAMDLVRWRPILIASVATMAGFIALVMPNFPISDSYKWVDKLSVFRAFNPIEVVTKGESLAFNCGILGLVGGIGILVGSLIFLYRDIPSAG